MRPKRHDEDVEPGVTYDCVTCGDPWLLPDGQAAWFAARDWAIPKRCPNCREANKRQRRDDAA